MEKKYVMLDIEASGPYPRSSSMLSFGACIVGNTEKNFYTELKPIRADYSLDHIKIGCRGLKSLEDVKHLDEYNPESKKFNVSKVLDVLEKKGESPAEAIPNFINWVYNSTKGYRPILAAAPILFDGMFISHYIDKFWGGENPFGHTGEDINSMFRGKVDNINGNIRDLSLRDKKGLNHNALDDAIQEAKEFYTILVHMNQANI